MTATEKLFTHRLLDSPEAVREFESALQEIGERGVSVNELPELFRCFDDRAQQQEVMWGLLHLIETLPEDAFVPAVMAQSSALGMSAPQWLRRLVVGLLNHPGCRSIFVREFRRSPKEVQTALEPTLTGIAASPAPGAATASELLKPRP